MSSTFLSDLLVTVIGTALGTLFTVAVAVVTYVVKLRGNELSALNELILELSHRRAFAGDAVRIANVDEGDYSRCNASVLSAREDVRRARGQVRMKPSLRDPLARMTGACNAYLEAAAWDPGSYAIELVRLRDKLHEEIRELGRQRSDVVVLRPGEQAFT